MIGRQIGEHLERERASGLRETEGATRELLSYVVDSSDDAIVTNSQDAAITSWNRAAERLYGYTAEEAIGRPVSMIEPPDHEGEQAEVLRRVFAGETVDQLESERVRKGGSTIVVSLTISPVRDADDKIVSVAVIARDITERKRDEDRLRHLAEHDQLTGLVNRRRFDQELKRELAKAGRYHSHSAVLSVDIDNFKAINDSAGHAAGDAVLTEVADVLSNRFGSTDVVARLGGDEFGVLGHGGGHRGGAGRRGRSARHDSRPSGDVRRDAVSYHGEHRRDRLPVRRRDRQRGARQRRPGDVRRQGRRP